MNVPIAIIMAATLGYAVSASANPTYDSLLEKYRYESSDELSAVLGEALWNREFTDSKSGKPRSCSSCHGVDLAKQGKHVRTGKRIEPMALRVNSARLTDSKKIEKWFKRNCKWTLGRECTPGEKGSFMLLMKSHQVEDE